MPLHLTWEQIALRLLLACIASFIIGLNRDEHGHPAGTRTTMLVCLAATLAMLQVNLLLPIAGKPPSSFVVMDLMRLPLGILSGIGFIGAGVIVKRDANVSGVTTAATLWLVTVLGLLFGGGNLYLGAAGSLIAFAILWALKIVERYFPHEFHASLHLDLSSDSLSEAELRQRLLESDWKITHWSALYDPPTVLTTVDCELKWRARASRIPETPPFIEDIRILPGIRNVAWKE
ncbi:MAG TPA: MgtC/SapB family protein [Bryobacteraceae bacterium]|nr:MgtC/SapB family protein [Bryobacteraceae bacterium]